MSNPTLTPVNCAGDTCSVRLGRDLESANPSALRGEVLFDGDSINCDDTGLHVVRCNPVDNLDAAQLPVDVDNGNALRKVEQCGLIVVPPLVKSEGAGVLVDIPSGSNDLSAISKTFNYTNSDLVNQLVTLEAVVNVRCEKTNADNTSARLRVAIQANGNINALGGNGSVRQLITFLTYDDDVGTVMHDRRSKIDQFIVPPGATLTVAYRTETLSYLAVDTNNANSNGFNVQTLVSRIEQVRSS